MCDNIRVKVMCISLFLSLLLKIYCVMMEYLVR